MTLAERLRALASALPSDASAVTFTRRDLLVLVEGSAEATTTPTRDMTVQGVADQVGRSASAVRLWLSSGRLRGYKLNGRDWRVPPAALREYLDRQVAPPDPADGPGVDISAWRRVKAGLIATPALPSPPVPSHHAPRAMPELGPAALSNLDGPGRGSLPRGALATTRRGAGVTVAGKSALCPKRGDGSDNPETKRSSLKDPDRR